MNDHSTMRRCIWGYITALLLCLQGIFGSEVLTQTHPAAPYVCRTGNITLRCQYDGVENVLVVLWIIGVQPTSNASTIPGHTALPRTTTYQEVVVDSYTNLAAGYRCEPTFSNGSLLQSNTYIPQVESAQVTISNLTLASRTATTLNVTWSAGYPKCYSFTVSHSTQDGSINVTQPVDSVTSHTLTSLQSSTTYRIEVEAVRKGDGVSGQRAKVMGNFSTDDEAGPTDTTNTNPTGTTDDTPTLGSSSGLIIGGIVGPVVAIAIVCLALIVVTFIVIRVLRRKSVPGTTVSTPTEPTTSSPGNEASGNEDTKQVSKTSASRSLLMSDQNYAVLDWQNPEQRPAKAPDNEWFTVQYSEVCFDGNN